MTTGAAIALMLAIEVTALLWASWQPNPYRLRGVCVTLNMIAIARFGPALFEIGGYTTNIGNIWFASAVCAQLIILERHGRTEALATIGMVYGALTFMFALGLAVHAFPVLPDNDTGRAIHIVTDHQTRIIMASYVAFFLSQMTMIMAWERVRPHMSAVAAAALAMAVCQLVDTPVFFVGAFADAMPVDVLIEVAVVGFVAKCLIGGALLPVFVVALRLPAVRAAVARFSPDAVLRRR